MDLEKDAKLIKHTVSITIYGPYPKNNPNDRYMISFSKKPERKGIWANSFDELVKILELEIKKGE